MDFTKFNKASGQIDWGINTKGFPFKKIREIVAEGKERVKIRGLFLSKGTFGLQGNLIAEGYIISLPKNLTETVKSIIDSPEAVEAVKRGELAVSFREYHSDKYNKDCWSINFLNDTPTCTSQAEECPF